jgi:hypothetical protein
VRQRNFTNIFLLMAEEQEEEGEPTRKEKERQ